MSEDFMKQFRKVISQAIATRGDAFDPEIEQWGDSRGKPLPEVTSHMKHCGVASMKGYDEHCTWSHYDTIRNEDTVGLKAFITCECGEVQNVMFLVEAEGIGTILNWILSDEELQK